MFFNVLTGCLIPFIGTIAGACTSLFDSGRKSENINGILSGAASGVMVAASVWSLIIPSVEYSAHLNSLSFLPACAGLFLGVLFMIAGDRIMKKHFTKSGNIKDKMLFFAVTLHNIPEGFAVGAAYSAYVYSADESLAASALMLSMGIAIQNIPEGAIVALPFQNRSLSRARGFIIGVLSGAVEPFAVIMTVVLSDVLIPLLPYTLSFAAGAMLYAVIKELVPDFSEGEGSDRGILAFTLGFTVMMSLDVAFS